MALPNCQTRTPRRLYPHQARAFRYTWAEPCPALFMEMRLGKTLVTVRRCLAYTPRDRALGLRVLVAAPASALGAWEKEAALEGADTCWIACREKRTRQRALAASFQVDPQRGARPRFCLLNREGWIALPEVAGMPWDAVVADESTFLKCPKSGVTKFFLRNFRDVPHRWALTGTPNPEGDEDLFCQLAFLYGSFMGCRNYWQFRARHISPFGILKAWSRSQLQREVGRRCLVMRRRDVGMGREKVHERREVVLPDELRKAYRKAERDFILEWEGKEEKRTIWMTAAWQWLRQLASGFLDGRVVWPGKVEEVVELAMGELRRDPFVVWCTYNAEIFAIAEALKAAGCPALTLTGEDALPMREAKRKTFFNGGARALVLQQAIAQTGVDLSVADTAIYFSTPCGQMARSQTEDRILSMQKGGPLLYVDLVCKGTVDEDVLGMLRQKGTRSDASLSRALAVAMRERKPWTEN